MSDDRRLVRSTAGMTVGVAVLVVAVSPAAAQSSFNEALIRGLNRNLLYVAIPIAVLVELVLFYAVYRFRASAVDEPKPTQENRRLEITWTVATAVILTFVGFAAYQVMGAAAVSGVSEATIENPTEPAVGLYDGKGAVGPPEDAENILQVEVVAERYQWTYNYRTLRAKGNQSAFVSRSSGESQPMVVPADTAVYIHVTSTDWIHSFHVPELALKQDAFPGRYNTIVLRDAEPGTYKLYCAEYCGVGHSEMTGNVEVLPRAENPRNPANGTWEHWVQQHRAELDNQST